ncbi:U11/U12 small nuclear ribonucleoprotein 48 kDa protein [Brachionichthys hirsutus]|uniref:U11/U12 small nuclear ribonucleoprotein 48 kDa protein n=1 Tax=Brachionichthys hirsutus TaxID=412623 RepID=UPI003604A6E4
MSDLLQIKTPQDRLDLLRDLTQFTESCSEQLDAMFEALGWSRDEARDQEALEQCPYDPDHRVPARSMEKHKTSCCLGRMGYTAEEQAETIDPSVCYQNAVGCYTMDKVTQHQVILQARSAAPLMKMEGVFWQGQFSGQPVDVPQNHKRAVCDLTVADRLALYDHVGGVLRQQKEAAAGNDDLYLDLMSKLQKDDGGVEPKTHLELMAEMRDYKRRRQSYRAKNVHITKKSYTEVIREVIQVHSEELSRQWREEEEEDCPHGHGELTRTAEDAKRREENPPSESSESRRHRSRDGSRDGGSRKRRRKDRDSRSPEERHHSRKKKKKKKKKKDEKDK